MKANDSFGYKFTKKFIKTYGLPKKQCHVVIFQDFYRYQLQKWLKKDGNTCLPLETLFKEFKFDRLHLKGKSLKDFGMIDVESIQFQCYSSGIVSKVTLEEGDVIHDSLSKVELAADKIEIAQAIEARYKSKTKEAKDLKTTKEFKYLKFNDSRKILYMFDPKEVKTKYRYKLTTEGYAEAKLRLNTLKNKYPEAFVDCKKGGCCFVDFVVRVTPHSGELKFSRGNTDESSSSE